MMGTSPLKGCLGREIFALNLEQQDAWVFFKQ